MLRRNPSLPALALLALLAVSFGTWMGFAPAPSGPTKSPHGQASRRPQARAQTPFMEEFLRSELTPSLVVQTFEIEAGSRKLLAYFVKPQESKPLPAILLAPADGLTEWIKRDAREIASVGFAALAVDYDPERVAAAPPRVQAVAQDQPLSRLGAAIDWLRAQKFVDRDRVGVIGWSESTPWVLRLAKQRKLQAVVVSGGSVCADPALLLQIRNVPVLLIEGGRDPSCGSEREAAFEERLRAANLPHTVRVFAGVSGEFMGVDDGQASSKEAADRAWLEIYRFLARNVEDANRPSPTPPPSAQPQIARIVDIMRAINSEDGVRGRLARSLATKPSTDLQWDEARSLAAVMAEAGNLLLARQPPKGSLDGWKLRASEYGDAVQTLLRAIEQHDLAAAQEAQRQLSQACAACHAEYR